MTPLERSIARGELAAELVYPGVPTPTVPDAAAALGVEEARILKSLLFQAPDGQVLLAIACGTARVNTARLAMVAGAERLKLAPPAVVFERTGYPPGGTPPVAHVTAFPVFIDDDVLALDEAFAGGGQVDAMLRIAPAEIARVTGATIADIAD
jgi:Cys-tRNA(Pro)/Cys-tRNA(Cys) deacylase